MRLLAATRPWGLRPCTVATARWQGPAPARLGPRPRRCAVLARRGDEGGKIIPKEIFDLAGKLGEVGRELGRELSNVNDGSAPSPGERS